MVFTLNGGAVVWRSSKQETIADSTCEAEYIAVSDAAKEAVWIKKFVSDLGVVPSIEKQLRYFATILEQFLNRRNLGHIIDPSMYSENII